MNEKHIEGAGGKNGLDPYFVRGEPIELLAAVEQDLKGADRDAERAEAEPIQFLAAPARAAGRKIIMRENPEFPPAG